MSTLLKIPKAAVSMQEGILTSWLVADGAAVVEGQPIYTLELEKSTMDVEAPAGGILRQSAAAGTTLKVGELIGEIVPKDAPHRGADIVIAPGNMYHTGYVVADMNTAVRHWVEQVGAGPFVLFENFRFVDPQYRGGPVELELTIGFAYSGDSCIELIQTTGTERSIYGEGRGGLHHVGIAVPNLDDALRGYAAAGITSVFQAGFPFGGGCAYLDTTATLGVFTELVEVGSAAQGLLDQIRLAHKNWNRRDYIFVPS